MGGGGVGLRMLDERGLQLKMQRRVDNRSFEGGGGGVMGADGGRGGGGG